MRSRSKFQKKVIDQYQDFGDMKRSLGGIRFTGPYLLSEFLTTQYMCFYTESNSFGSLNFLV